jgi:hypothetical protein
LRYCPAPRCSPLTTPPFAVVDAPPLSRAHRWLTRSKHCLLRVAYSLGGVDILPFGGRAGHCSSAAFRCPDCVHTGACCVCEAGSRPGGGGATAAYLVAADPVVVCHGILVVPSGRASAEAVVHIRVEKIDRAVRRGRARRGPVACGTAKGWGPALRQPAVCPHPCGVPVPSLCHPACSTCRGTCA